MIIVLVCAGWIFFGVLPAEAKPGKSMAQTGFFSSFSQDKKEARALRREERKARRAAYKAGFYNGAGLKQDNTRMNRNNYKQRKKMDKASKKENRKKWGTNQGGDVFGVY